MRFISVLALCALVFASCSDDPASPDHPRVVYIIPGVGTEFDISWARFEEDGQPADGTRSDTVTILKSKDTTVAGRSGVAAFVSIDPENPGSSYRTVYTRVNASNDLEVIFKSDDVTLDKWITLPIQTRSQKTVTLDTLIENEGFEIIGSIKSSYEGEGTVTIDGNQVKVIKIGQSVNLEGKMGGTVIANLDGDRTYWYAPSLGYFVHIEFMDEGTDIDGDPYFEHTVEQMQRYILK